MKKKIGILLIINIFFMSNINKVFAYAAEGGGTGAGVEVIGSDCGDGQCFGGYTGFEFRITLLDQDLNRVEGTKIIEFGPIQPINGETPHVYKAYDIKNVAYQKTMGGDSKYATTYLCNNKQGNNLCSSYRQNGFFYSAKVDFDYGKKQITFLGSSRTKDGMLPENTELNRHYVYMGFGDTYSENTVDAGNFPNLKRKLVNYITSMQRKNYVEGYGNVSFIDYFLHVSGFSDSWEASKDYEMLDKIRKGEYYLMIEPIQHPGVRINGEWYGLDGTANQLAEFSNYNNLYGDGEMASYYSVGEHAYNLFCNFLDSKSILTDKDDKGALESCKKGTYESYESNVNSYLRTLSILSQANLPFGVSTFKLNQLWKELIDTNKCVYDIDTCNDNNFIFETKLYAIDKNQKESTVKTDIANCIYNMNEENREKYYYTATSAKGKKLYCYDDVTYDFKNLKKLENQNFKNSTFTRIPNGELKIDRTCISTTKFEDTNILENILIKDNTGNKQYQDKITFSFLGKKYTYSRDKTIYPIENRKYIETAETTEDGKPLQYTYTSSFSYYYKLDEGFDSYNSNIQVNKYSISNGIPDAKSILLEKNSSNSRIITVSQKNSDTYTNELSLQINNACGLSTKTLERLSSNKELITNSEKKLDRKGIVYSTESKVELEILSDNNNTCKFDATSTNHNAYQFRVISLSNPFPARDGTSRIPGKNWLNNEQNNVYNYIQNNRNVNSEKVYEKKPLYTVTLDAKKMVKIREYNKTHSYSDSDITCEIGTGRMCIDNFIRNDYLKLGGTCSNLKSSEIQKITDINEKISDFIKSECRGNNQCMQLYKDQISELDTNKDKKVDDKDYLNTNFYTCADKTAKSGG